MSERPSFSTRRNRPWARLLAFVSFVLVMVGTTHRAQAARVPAPMCTPDAQSMPAPLQRTATSAAEIKRGACPSAQGPSWDVLPNRTSLPINWYQFAGDPLWLGGTSVRASQSKVVSLNPEEAERALKPGVTCEIFRPPKRSFEH